MFDARLQIGSSVDALGRELEIITHNLANVNTAGYKRRSNAFSQMMEKVTQGRGENPKIELKTEFDFSQAGVNNTGRAMDFALYGEGFFVIETPEGAMYTRNGSFMIGQNGQIVDSQGRTVAGQDGPILIPENISASQVHVSKDGNVSADGVEIGKFKIVEFGDEINQLTPAGNSCFRFSDPNYRPVDSERTTVQQGFREASNVEMIEELVDMIMVTRLYESNMKFLSAKSQTTSSIISAAMG